MKKNGENVYAQLFLYILLERVAKAMDDTWWRSWGQESGMLVGT